MSRHLFYSALLLLVPVMMCCDTGGAAEGSEQASEPTYKWKVIPEGVTVESLGAPGLLKVGSDVFAVAEAKNKEKEGQGSFTGIASQLLTKTVEKKDNTPVEVLKDPKETQFLEEDGSDDPKEVDVSRPTTVVKGNDIYMLVGKYSHAAATGKEDGGAEDGGLLLVKGEVSDESDSGKRIKWSDANAVPRASFGELDSWTGLIGSGGSGVKMHDDTLAFPVEGTKKGDAPNGKKAISLLLYSSDNAASWKLSKGMSDGGCSDPSVVEWGEKDKLIMMTACDDGRRRVYESDDMGDSWTEALGTLSRVWSNKKGNEKGVRSGFITAKIDGGENNRNVMLVTLPVYAKETDKKETGNGKGKLHLWLTDNTHIVDIGPVSDDDAAASSLLYKSAGSGDMKEKLIALYEKKKDEGKPSHSLWSVLLTEQLQRVKDVLLTWKKMDDRVSKLCPSKSAVESTSPGNACSAVIPTDGLVSFLSGNFSENTWRDEYLGVNATVKNKGGATEDKGATKTSDGVKFTGAWAEWPVGEQGENQLYHFANYNFTLVATVSIHKLPEEEGSPISLMGVKVDDDGKTVLLGLSYNGGGKWRLSCRGGTDTEDHSINLSTETTHHVVILLRNDTQGSAYVDGQRVGGGEACALENKDSEAISHFYIGGDGGPGVSRRQEEGVSVTVTNVLLYNRLLDYEEIAGISKNKITNPKREVPKTSTTSPLPPAVSGSDVQTTAPLSNSAGQLPSAQGQPKGSIAAGAGGASTQATSTAAASSGQEPVKQPTSGTSPSGNKNADGTPSSDADPTVTPGTSPDGGQTVDGGSTADSEPTTDTRKGGTNGQEKVNTHNGEVNATALSSSLGNVSQGNNSDAGTVCGSGLLPSLLLLLGLWVFAAL